MLRQDHLAALGLTPKAFYRDEPKYCACGKEVNTPHGNKAKVPCYHHRPTGRWLCEGCAGKLVSERMQRQSMYEKMFRK